MRFCENDYLGWYLPRIHGAGHAINLHASGVPSLGEGDLAAATGDPWGMPARFEAGLAKWLGIPASEILFAPGATGGTLLALLALAGPESEILVESPIYEPMLRQAERLGPVRRFHRRMEDGWGLRLNEVAGLMSDRTAVVMVTEPSNPSGTFAPRKEILSLADLAAHRGAYLLVNEVYRRFGDAPSYHGAAPNIVVVSSLSKLFGAYGLRLGWLSARADLIARLGVAHINLTMGNHAAAAVGVALLERADELVRRAVALAAGGRDRVDAWASATPGVGWIPPHGAGFGCLRLPTGVDDVAFAERLHRERDVLVVPGAFFGVPGTLRLSWLQVGDDLEEGLARLAAAIDGWCLE